MSMVKVKDGTATLNSTATLDNWQNEEFLGSTGEGSFPPMGTRYTRFTFTPKFGENGILVFYNECSKWVSLHQYYWKNDKLVVTYAKVNRPTRQFSRSREFEFIIQVGDCCYVTKAPAEHDSDFKLVGLLQMLKYVDGKIDQEELESCSKSFMRRPKSVLQIEDLEKLVKHLRDHCESLGHEIHKRDIMYGPYKEAVRNFVKTFSWVPLWMRPKTMKAFFKLVG